MVLVIGCRAGSGESPPAPVVDSAAVAVAPADTTAAGAGRLDSLFAAYEPSVLAPTTVDTAAAAHWVDSVLAALTLEQKIGQLFIVHLPGPGVRRVVDDAGRAVTAYGVGGFLVPRLLDPRTVLAETQRLQQASAVPLFFAADYERGAGRFNNALTELPSNMALGAARDTLWAAAAGRLTALESRALGVNLLFAPVVDVNNNPENPIINIRSYGEDPDLVGRLAAAFVGEAERYGVLTTLKHFPGHGNTAVDSHTRLGVVPGNAAALDSVELRPYRAVLRRPGAAGVMTAHLWVPAFDGEPVPATLSRRVVHDVLRDSLGFDGIVVTDDIRMGALRKNAGADASVVRSLQAGADVVLTPASLSGAVRAVRAAVRRGDLTEAALDRSVRRILQAKARAGLHVQAVATSDALDYLLAVPRGEALARAIAARAVTLLKADATLPLRADRRVALVQMSTIDGAASISAAMDTLAAALAPATDARLDVRPSAQARAEALRAAAQADAVVLALYLRLQSGRGEAGLYEPQARFVRDLLALDVPVVLVTFGNPYAVVPFAEAEGLLVAYEQSLATVAATARILQGRRPAYGRLPITVGRYPFGSGL